MIASRLRQNLPTSGLRRPRYSSSVRVGFSQTGECAAIDAKFHRSENAMPMSPSENWNRGNETAHAMTWSARLTIENLLVLNCSENAIPGRRTAPRLHEVAIFALAPVLVWLGTFRN